MADFTYQGTQDGVEPTQSEFDVASGTTASIAIGDVVVMANGFAAKVADGGCNAIGVYGLAVSASDETAAAAGTVSVVHHPNGLVLRGAPSGTPAAANVFDPVSMDVDGGTGVQTVDENDTGAGYALIVKSFDNTAGTIDVVLQSLI